MGSSFDNHEKSRYTPLEIAQEAARRYHSAETRINAGHKFYKQVLRALDSRGYTKGPYSIPRDIANEIIETDLFPYFYKQADPSTQKTILQSRKKQHDSFKSYQSAVLEYYREGVGDPENDPGLPGYDLEVYEKRFLRAMLRSIFEELISLKKGNESMVFDEDAYRRDYASFAAINERLREDEPYISDDLESYYVELEQLEKRLSSMSNYIKPRSSEQSR